MLVLLAEGGKHKMETIDQAKETFDNIKSDTDKLQKLIVLLLGGAVIGSLLHGAALMFLLLKDNKVDLNTADLPEVLSNFKVEHFNNLFGIMGEDEEYINAAIELCTSSPDCSPKNPTLTDTRITLTASATRTLLQGLLKQNEA